MSKATELSDALEVALGAINAANGYASDIKAVYGFGQNKKDNAPLPCLLVRIKEDSGADRVGSTCKRQAEYVIEGIFPRTASLQDLQRCHHDILRGLGYGSQLPERALRQGTITEESAEYDLEQESAARRVITRLGISYVETY